jgi:hypothetical protein
MAPVASAIAYTSGTDLYSKIAAVLGKDKSKFSITCKDRDVAIPNDLGIHRCKTAVVSPPIAEVPLPVNVIRFQKPQPVHYKGLETPIVTVFFDDEFSTFRDIKTANQLYDEVKKRWPASSKLKPRVSPLADVVPGDLERDDNPLKYNVYNVVHQRPSFRSAKASSSAAAAAAAGDANASASASSTRTYKIRDIDNVLKNTATKDQLDKFWEAAVSHKGPFMAKVAVECLKTAGIPVDIRYEVAKATDMAGDSGNSEGYSTEMLVKAMTSQKVDRANQLPVIEQTEEYMYVTPENKLKSVLSTLGARQRSLVIDDIEQFSTIWTHGTSAEGDFEPYHDYKIYTGLESAYVSGNSETFTYTRPDGDYVVDFKNSTETDPDGRVLLVHREGTPASYVARTRVQPVSVPTPVRPVSGKGPTSHSSTLPYGQSTVHPFNVGLVVWSWQRRPGDFFEKYPDDITAKLEAAYITKKGNVELNAKSLGIPGLEKVVVDFHTSTQRSEGVSYAQSWEVRRNNLSTSNSDRNSGIDTNRDRVRDRVMYSDHVRFGVGVGDRDRDRDRGRVADSDKDFKFRLPITTSLPSTRQTLVPAPSLSMTVPVHNVIPDSFIKEIALRMTILSEYSESRYGDLLNHMCRAVYTPCPLSVRRTAHQQWQGSSSDYHVFCDVCRTRIEEAAWTNILLAPASYYIGKSSTVSTWSVEAAVVHDEFVDVCRACHGVVCACMVFLPATIEVQGATYSPSPLLDPYFVHFNGHVSQPRAPQEMLRLKGSCGGVPKSSLATTYKHQSEPLDDASELLWLKSFAFAVYQSVPQSSRELFERTQECCCFRCHGYYQISHVTSWYNGTKFIDVCVFCRDIGLPLIVFRTTDDSSTAQKLNTQFLPTSPSLVLVAYMPGVFYIAASNIDALIYGMGSNGRVRSSATPRAEPGLYWSSQL